MWLCFASPYLKGCPNENTHKYMYTHTHTVLGCCSHTRQTDRQLTGRPWNPGSPLGPGAPGAPGQPGFPLSPFSPSSPGSPGGPIGPGSPDGDIEVTRLRSEGDCIFHVQVSLGVAAPNQGRRYCVGLGALEGASCSTWAENVDTNAQPKHPALQCHLTRQRAPGCRRIPGHHGRHSGPSLSQQHPVYL